MKAKRMTNEDLAETLRTIKATGVCPTAFERECLDEAADRLEDFEHRMKQVRGYAATIRELNSKIANRLEGGDK